MSNIYRSLESDRRLSFLPNIRRARNVLPLCTQKKGRTGGAGPMDGISLDYQYVSGIANESSCEEDLSQD